MEIILQGENCIITPLSPVLCKSQTDRLRDTINEHKMYSIGMNLDNVVDCSIDFVEMLLYFKNLNLYNITPDIFAIFNKMGIDKKINLYNSENDYLAREHRLLNRCLKVIS